MKINDHGGAFINVSPLITNNYKGEISKNGPFYLRKLKISGYKK